MPNSRKPDGVGKIVEAAKRILDTVLQGTSKTPTAGPPERRAPIPPTPPPRLLRAPASLPPRHRSSAEPTTEKKAGEKKAGEKKATKAAEPGMQPEAVAGLVEAERPHRRGDEPPYEQLTKAELYELAQQRDIPGRSTMSKGELIEALRMR